MGIEEVDSEPKALCLEAPLQDRGKSGELSFRNVKGLLSKPLCSLLIKVKFCTFHSRPTFLMKTLTQYVTLCEDHLIVSDGLRSIINAFEGFEVNRSVTSYKELQLALKNQVPDILILDLNLPDKNGLEILQELREQEVNCKIVVLTMYNKKSVIQKVQRLGAAGYLLKNCSSEDLEDALRHVLQSNKFYFGEGVKIRESWGTDEGDDNFSKSIQLTSREKEIVICLCEGKKVPDIAEIMNISPFTVETHKKNIYRKLGVDSTVKLVNFAHENQLI